MSKLYSHWFSALIAPIYNTYLYGSFMETEGRGSVRLTFIFYRLTRKEYV